MSLQVVERRLVEVSDRLKQLRGDLQVTDEQCLHFEELAGDARLRALVSETPAAERQHRDAARQAEAMGRHQAHLQKEISRLEKAQDELLDRLSSGI